jgi:hypothetical protein
MPLIRSQPGAVVRAGSLVSPGGEQGVPGEKGTTGDSGDTGIAYTWVVEDFQVPPTGQTVDVKLSETDFIVKGQWLAIEGIGSFEITTLDRNAQTATLLNPALTPSGISEAPLDGRQYGRQRGSWTEVIGGGDGAGTEFNLGQKTPDRSVDTTGFTLGLNFTVAQNGYLKEVSFYKTANEAANVNHSFIIWDTAGVPLWNHPPDNEQAVEGWMRHRFPIPLPLDAGTYVLGVYMNLSYGATESYLPRTDGPLTGNANYYIQGNGFPTTESTTYYSIDLVFATGLGTSTSQRGSIIFYSDSATPTPDDVPNPQLLDKFIYPDSLDYFEFTEAGWEYIGIMGQFARRY